MIVDAMPVTRRIAIRHRGGLDEEEAISVAYFALTTAATRFDESRGVPFKAFAAPCVIGALKDAMRSSGPLGNSRTTGKLTCVPLDAEDAPQVADRPMFDVSLRAVDLSRCVQGLRRGKQAYAIAKLLIAGWDDDSIVELTRINRGTYDATKAFVLRRLKEEIARPRKEYRPWRGRVAETARQAGVVAGTVRDRMRRGVPIAKALQPHGVTIDGVTLPMAVWARRAGLKPATVVARIAKGVPPKEALARAVPGGWGVTRKRVK